MKAALACVAALLAALSVSFAQSSMASRSDDETTLRKIEDDWGMAMVKADTAQVDRFTAAEWTVALPDGSLATKDQVLADAKTGVMKCEAFKNDDVKVRIYGDTAVVSGMDTEKSSYKGADTSGQYRYTDVFMKRNGVWTCVATHVSKVAPAPSPTS